MYPYIQGRSGYKHKHLIGILILPCTCEMHEKKKERKTKWILAFTFLKRKKKYMTKIYLNGSSNQ